MCAINRFSVFYLKTNQHLQMDKDETPLDISQWIVNGMNTIRCIELSGEGGVFILSASSTPSDKRNQRYADP